MLMLMKNNNPKIGWIIKWRNRKRKIRKKKRMGRKN
jgi:hypothetical protein